MTKLKVRVTRDLVKEAIRQSNSRCGISLALKDLGFDRPIVTQTSISYSDNATGMRYTVETPERVAKWIDDFDSNRVLPGPLTFDIDPDEDSIIVKPIHRSQPSELIAKARRDSQRATKAHFSQGTGKSYRPQRVKS